ncbi:Dabb family protein [Sphingomonas sp. ac-8]|uniref:Dabb family protein n=1 Tax=Sphingomonas sp. ac-8 TaxID=3242977 RepID=UPI003A7FC123
MGLLLLLGLAPAGGAAAAAGARKQIVHHVFFWLKNPASQADAEKLITGLRTLRAIPQIRELRIGVPAATEQRSVVESSYQVSELMVFDSVEDQRRYQEHPIHKAFVAACEGLWDRVVVYDSVDV